MLTVKELYDFLREHGIEDNCIDILYREDDCTKWFGYEHDKAETIEKHGNREVYGVDIYEKD